MYSTKPHCWHGAAQWVFINGLKGLTLLIIAAISLPALASPSEDSDQSRHKEDASQLEAVVVTGSRIQRNGYQSPTPVTSLPAEQLQEKAPTTLADALNTLPQFAGSSGPATTSMVEAVSPTIGNYLNLRNLDPRRTLVLLDGDRLPPTSFNGSVSIDVLPQFLVQRVDVVTGGASAVYGSDAVVGVVNFILDKNFTGIKALAQVGAADGGDDRHNKLGLAAGTSLFDGRLHLMGSVDYYHSDGIPDASARPYGNQAYCETGTGTVSSPYTFARDCRSSIATAGGLIFGGPLSGYTFLPNGTAVPFNPGGPGGIGAGPYAWRDPAGSSALVEALETRTAFGRIGFDITPDVNIYGQVTGAQSINGPDGSGVDNHIPGQSNAITIYKGNAFLNPAVAAAYSSFPAGSPLFFLSRWTYPTDAEALGTTDIPNPVSKQTSDFFSVKTGAEGKFGGAWTWAATYTYGNSKFNDYTDEVNNINLIAATDAVVGPSGTIVCRVTLTNPGLYPGCVPFNPFGPGSPSQAAVNYVEGVSHWWTSNIMNVVDAHVGGSPFSLPSGPVSIVFGAEYRNQSLFENSNSNPAVTISPTGLRTLAPNLTRFNIVDVGAANGSVDVKEAYAEVVVPLLHDLPLLKSLEFNGAARFTDYSTSGAVDTWKAGLNYIPVTGLRIRGTISHDIRAPDLYDLFAGVQNNPLIFNDPHTGVATVGTVVSTGNSALAPEDATTKTIGFVYQPAWSSGLGISVDYYDIKIEHAIVELSGADELDACEASNGTSSVCSLIIRPHPFSDHTPDNVPTELLSQPVNSSVLTQRGVDLELSYRLAASSLVDTWKGDFEFKGLASYVPEFSTTVLPGSAPQNSAGYDVNAKLRGTMDVTYRTDRWDVNVQERMIESTKRGLYSGYAYYADHSVNPGIAYTSLTWNYRLPLEHSEWFLTVNNLFDKRPPLLPGSGNNTPDLLYPTNQAIYDVIGRYITIGLRFRF